MSELNIPNTWAETNLEDLVYLRARIGWKGLKANEYTEKGPLFLSVREINNNGTLTLTKVNHISDDRYDESPEIMLKDGDVIISKDGSIGKVAFVEGLKEKATVNSSMAVLTPHFGLHYKFLFHYLKAPSFQLLVKSKIQGAAVPHIFQKDLRVLVMPLPALKEQERIVQKIESCFEKIDATEQNLTKVETLLEKYRESLLAKAFRGELIPQNESDEPASVLLEKIRAEREKSAPAKKKKVQAFAPITDDEKPFDIPESWEWVRFGEITNNLDGSRRPIKSADRKNRQGVYPYYGASGIIDTYDDFIFEGEHLLVSEDGANLLARKYPIAFIASGKFWVNNHAHIVQALDCTSNRFLELYFELIDISRWVTGAAQPKFNQAKLNSVPVPVPPISEQKRIIERLNIKYEVQESSSREIKNKRVLFTRLKESVLNKAFSGQLVEQIKSEGTGQELLEKILKAKAEEASKKKVTKKKITKKLAKKKSSKKKV